LEATLNSSLGRTTLGAGTLTLGRAPDNKIVVNDPQASSHHAEIAAGPGETSYIVTDLNSTNGTFVNEQRLSPRTPRTLNANDVIRIGAVRFTYEVAGAVFDPTVRADSAGYDATVFAPSGPSTPGFPSGSSTPGFENYGGNYGTPPPQQPSYPQPGYPQPGYSQPGYPQAGYPQAGYPQPGYPQPGYPQPGIPPVPGAFGMPTQPKKSSAGLWITIAVVVLVLIIGGGGAAFLIANQSTPTKTLQAFCTALKNGDAQGEYDLYSTPIKSKVTLDQVKQQNQQIQSLGGFSDCTVSNVQETGSTATGDITLTARVNGKTAPPIKLNLVNESGTWKIDASPTNQGTTTQ